MSKNAISFLPDDYVKRREARRTNLLCLCTFAVVLVALIGIFILTMRQEQQVASARQVLNASLLDAARTVEKFEKLQQRQSDLMVKAEMAIALREPVPRSILLAELIGLMPSQLSLTRFDLQSRTITPPPPPAPKAALKSRRSSKRADKDETPDTPLIPITEVSLSIEGIAETDVLVADLVRRLKQSPLFDRVVFKHARQVTIDGRSARQFRIDWMLAADADVRALPPRVIPGLDDMMRKSLDNSFGPPPGELPIQTQEGSP